MTTETATTSLEAPRSLEERRFQALLDAAHAIVRGGRDRDFETLRRVVRDIDEELALACGEVGTAWPYGGAGQPRDTSPCRLPAGHEEDHDWAQRERAEEARWRGDAARDIGRESRQLGDSGWQRLEDRAVNAGYDRESVRSRRRRDDFTTHTIEVAYDLGLRRAAEVARGRTR